MKISKIVLQQSAAITEHRYTVSLTNREQMLPIAWKLIKHEKKGGKSDVHHQRQLKQRREKRCLFKCISADTKRADLIVQVDIETALRCIRGGIEYTARDKQYRIISVLFN